MFGIFMTSLNVTNRNRDDQARKRLTVFLSCSAAAMRLASAPCCSSLPSMSFLTRSRGGAAGSHSRRRKAAAVYLAGVRAKHLVDGLRAAGLIVARQVQ